MSPRFWIWSTLVILGALLLADLCKELLPFDVGPAPRLFAGLYFGYVLSPVLYLGPLVSRLTPRRTRWVLGALLLVQVLLFAGLAFFTLLTSIAART